MKSKTLSSGTRALYKNVSLSDVHRLALISPDRVIQIFEIFFAIFFLIFNEKKINIVLANFGAHPEILSDLKDILLLEFHGPQPVSLYLFFQKYFSYILDEMSAYARPTHLFLVQ